MTDKPQVRGQRQPGHAARGDRRATAEPPRARRPVLLVEDSKIIAKMVSQKLESALGGEVRVESRLAGMVMAGGVAPAEWPPSPPELAVLAGNTISAYSTTDGTVRKITEFESTPNPNAVKCWLDKPISDVPRSFLNAEMAAEDPVAAALFERARVSTALFNGSWISVNKQPDADWDRVKAIVREVLAEAADVPT